MEFGKHLAKGFWGAADKSLPVVYGLGLVLLVIRSLPAEEFGNYVLFQDIFLILSGLATAFALQPLVKFAAEEDVCLPSITTISVLLFTLFIGAGTAILILFRHPLAVAFKSDALPSLLWYLPLTVLAAHPRNISLSLLQAHLKIKEVFWIDALHFLGAPALMWAWSALHGFHSALELIVLTIISQGCSSLLSIQLSRPYLRFTLRPARKDFRNIWEYGKYALGATVSGFAGSKADTFIISAFSGVTQLALYNSVKVFIRAYDMITQVVQLFIVPATSRLASRGDRASLVSLIEKGILFGTITMVPLFLLYLVFAQPLIQLLYHGRYLEAVPILRVLAIPSLVTPALAIAGTALLGLGEARAIFWIGVQTVVINLAAYLLFIPWMGALGAGIASTTSCVVVLAISLARLRQSVPFTAKGIASRRRELSTFVRQKLDAVRH